MKVEFTPDQKAFIRQAIESGRLQREEDAVKEALSLWEERERRRLEILVAVDQAEMSLARGEGRRVTTLEEARQLAGDVKRRGMARLADKRKPCTSASFVSRPRRRLSLTTSGFTSRGRAAASISPPA